MERLATRVFQHEYSLAVVCGYREGSNRPYRIQIASQRVFVIDLVKGSEGGLG
jgi:hypothetical protein